MGQAKQRGTYEERKSQAIERDGSKFIDEAAPVSQEAWDKLKPGPSISPLKLDKKLGMFGLSRWRKRRK